MFPVWGIEEQHLRVLYRSVFFILYLFSLQSGYYNNYQCSRHPPPSSPPLLLPPLLFSSTPSEVCVVKCVCGSFKQRAAHSRTKAGPCVEMRPTGWDALSLRTSPAGSQGSSWLVALCLQTDGNGQRGEEERRRRDMGRDEWKRGRGGERVSLFSLTLGIEGVAALTMRQQPWMVPLSFRLTLLPSVHWTCHKVCVQCIHYTKLHVPIWHVNMPYSWALICLRFVFQSLCLWRFQL